MCQIMTSAAQFRPQVLSPSSQRKGSLTTGRFGTLFYYEQTKYIYIYILDLMGYFSLFVCSFVHNPRLEGPELMGFVRYDIGDCK